MINRAFTRVMLASVIGLMLIGSALAQGTDYHMKLVYETEPGGPNETFFVKLVFEEHDVDISAYQLIVGYDNTRGAFNNIHDNLGAAGVDAAAVLTTGAQELALDGVSYANVSRKILLDTASNVLPPVDPNDDFNLGLLEFTTSADYDTADGHFGIYLAADPAAGGYGVWYGIVEPLDVIFISLEPGSSVDDWSMY